MTRAEIDQHILDAIEAECRRVAEQGSGLRLAVSPVEVRGGEVVMDFKVVVPEADAPDGWTLYGPFNG